MPAGPAGRPSCLHHFSGCSRLLGLAAPGPSPSRALPLSLPASLGLSLAQAHPIPTCQTGRVVRSEPRKGRVGGQGAGHTPKIVGAERGPRAIPGGQMAPWAGRGWVLIDPTDWGHWVGSVRTRVSRLRVLRGHFCPICSPASPLFLTLAGAHGVCAPQIARGGPCASLRT